MCKSFEINAIVLWFKVLNDHLKSLRKIEINNEASEIRKHQTETSTAKNLGFIALKPKLTK
jgi:hypothetical protein